jgi:CRISPR system Cascade subunit CasE
MYFSRVEIVDYTAILANLSNKKTDKVYQSHQALWQLFATDSKQRFLFRAENNKQKSASTVYYLLSKEKPKQDHTGFKIETKSFAPKLQQGQKLAFKLRVNPVVTKALPGKTKSSRHDIIMDAKYQHAVDACINNAIISKDEATTKSYQLKYLLNKLRVSNKIANFNDFILEQKEKIDKACENWLINRSEKHGFIANNIEHYAHVQHSLKYSKGNNASFNSIDYNGKLEVTNPELFFDMLVNGLGPAKGFGCGLMLIRKV